MRDLDGKIWELVTEGSIGIDAGHLLAHRDTEEAVEVVYLEERRPPGRASGERLARLMREAVGQMPSVSYNSGLAHSSSRSPLRPFTRFLAARRCISLLDRTDALPM